MIIRSSRTRHMPPAFRYFGPATKQVSRYIPKKAYNAHVEHGILPAKALILSALFAHLRVRPHDTPVTNFEAELAECLEQRNIRNILEIGPQYFPFWPILKDIALSINVFGIGRDAANDIPSQGMRYLRGNILHGTGTFFNESFDLIVAIGVFTSLGFSPPIRSAQINQAAIDITNNLSENPRAAFFAASYKPLENPRETLLFRKSMLETETDILLWHQPVTKIDSPTPYLDKFSARPARRQMLSPFPSITVLAKKSEAA